MTEEIKVETTWDSPVSANYECAGAEEYYLQWLSIEGFCSTKDLSPGFYDWHGTGSVPGVTPRAEEGVMYPVRWTTYRAEDSTLLALHCCYVDPEGVQRPIYIFVHPDHQRKGLAKEMLNYVMTRHVAEIGKFDPNKSWQVPNTLRLTTPGAAFINWAGKEMTENKSLEE